MEHVQQREILFQVCDIRGWSCLHYAMDNASPYTHKIIELGEICKASHDWKTNVFWRHSLGEEDTPLHLAVKLGQVGNQTNAEVNEAALDFEDDDEMGSDSEEEWLNGHDAVSEVKAIKRRMTDLSGSTAASQEPQSEQADIATAGTKLHESSLQRKPTHLPSLISTRCEENEDRNEVLSPYTEYLVETVMSLVTAEPRVLIDKRDKHGDTPYQARVRVLEDNRRMKFKLNVDAEIDVETRRDMVNKDPIARSTRAYCIREFGRRDALTALYRTGEGSAATKLSKLRCLVHCR